MVLRPHLIDFHDAGARCRLCNWRTTNHAWADTTFIMRLYFFHDHNVPLECCGFSTSRIVIPPAFLYRDFRKQRLDLPPFHLEVPCGLSGAIPAPSRCKYDDFEAVSLRTSQHVLHDSQLRLRTCGYSCERDSDADFTPWQV